MIIDIPEDVETRFLREQRENKTEWRRRPIILGPPSDTQRAY